MRVCPKGIDVMSLKYDWVDRNKKNVSDHLRGLLRAHFKRDTLDVVVGVRTAQDGWDFTVNVFDPKNAEGFIDGAIEDFTRETLHTLIPESKPEIRAFAPQGI